MPDIQHLTPTDVALFRAMNAMFARAFEDAESYLSNPPSDAYLADLLAKPHVIALAAVHEGKVVGGLVAYQLDKFEQDRREIYIYDLAVDAAFRRQGIATALIDALRVEATRRDAWVIFVQADLVDAPAIALYDKLGTKETAHHFDIAPAKTGETGG
jgi:aminoglycoside 3-N-acetyltransferase I